MRTRSLRRPWSSRLHLEEFERRLTPSTYFVKTTADNGDNGDPTPGSLREAINFVNSGPITTIMFSVGAGTLAPVAPLPGLTKAVTIDTGGAKVVLNGGAAGASDGLTFKAGGTLRGLTINGFAGVGVKLLGGGMLIEGCFIGTNSGGTVAVPNSTGIVIEAGAQTIRDNLISGNFKSGIHFKGSAASGSTVTGNRIGVAGDGKSPLANGEGIRLDMAPGNTIGGSTSLANVISGNVGSGVVIAGVPASGNVIRGNRIGVSAGGPMIAIPNGGNGIEIGEAPGTIIGGTTGSLSNVIAGNKGNGIAISSGGALPITAPGATIQGNQIGVDETGTIDLGNGANGIAVDGSWNNLVGGADTAGNVIAGNALAGVVILAGSKNAVQGNRIGTTGVIALPNDGPGVSITAADNLVGGVAAGVNNLIAGNKGPGVIISGPGAKINRVWGNLIGVNSAATAALPNGGGGVHVVAGASGNMVGAGDADDGAADGFAKARNVISGNSGPGILIADSATAGNLVLANFIGLAGSGVAAVPNSGDGVVISHAPGNSIGGTLKYDTNYISGNAFSGVTISGATAVGNVVYQNVIGLSADLIAPAPFGNQAYGIFVFGNASANFIGTADGGNTIAFNGESIGQGGIRGHGILIDSGTKNTISRNSIYGNFGRGIDLRATTAVDDFVTRNDKSSDQDADTGANGLQNYPVVTRRSLGAAHVGVHTWTLNAAPNTTYTIEFFANDSIDPSGHGEGQTFLSAVAATTDAAGLAKVDFDHAGQKYVSATATDPIGNTSEFSMIDTDADGLADAWESGGIDGNEDGTIDLTLGTAPTHRDLFVEVDSMTGIYNEARVKSALASVVAAFADAPNSLVHNPDGLKGVTLHAVLDVAAGSDTDIAKVAWGLDHWTKFHEIKDGKSATGADGRFGSATDRASPNWVNIRDARRLVYRYGLFADSYQYESDGKVQSGSSGLAELGGDDFFVTLGTGWNTNRLSVRDLAGTFMHEFGHTLGLDHGGGDDDNRKPNYHSVMSYSWQIPTNTLRRLPNLFDKLRYYASARLDYSREEFLPLNENALLNEPVGIPTGNSEYAGLSFQFGVELASGKTHLGTYNAATDWNINKNSAEVGVAADINFDGALSTLTGHEDWSAVSYYFGESPWSGPGAIPTGGAEEREIEVTAAPPRVDHVTINDGSPQRSRVTSVTIAFDDVVDLPPNPADAFQLVRQSDNQAVALLAQVSADDVHTQVVLTFTGGAVEYGSLADGRYTLTILAGAVAGAGGMLDGNGDGMPGDDYVFASAAAPAPPTNLFRLFGDSDGDADVDTSDFAAFRAVFGGSSIIFDFDNDGDVDTTDFGAFRGRFGATI